MGYCWGFERMCQARTLPPGWVSTTAPLFLGNLVLLGLQYLLWLSLPFSWVMNSVCGLSSFLFIGLGLSSPNWPVIHFQFSSWSLFFHQPSARGGIIVISSKNQTDELSPMPLLPLLLVLRMVCLTNADLFLKVEFINPLLLKAFCVFAIFIS